MTTPLDLDDADDGDEVDLRTTKEKLAGVRVIKIRTDNGKVIVGY